MVLVPLPAPGVTMIPVTLAVPDLFVWTATDGKDAPDKSGSEKVTKKLTEPLFVCATDAALIRTDGAIVSTVKVELAAAGLLLPAKSKAAPDGMVIPKVPFPETPARVTV